MADADPADFDPSCDRHRCTREQGIAVAHDERLVVTDEDRATIDQAQREVGLARSRCAFDHHGHAVDRDRGGVEPVGGGDDHEASLLRQFGER
jgi:hypothetical protein